MSSSELHLSNQVCFLVHRLDQAISTRYRPLLQNLGLTYPQYLTMLALWEHGDLKIGALCSLVSLDTGTISPLVKRLESTGLLERIRRTDDERSVTVRLTQKGKDLEILAQDIPRTFANFFLADMEEFQDMKRILRALLVRLETKG